jgi:hypothetical protein
MATVLIHAGMPKTGSTSIQSWLRRHARYLRERHGIHVVRETGGEAGAPLRCEPFESGFTTASNRFVLLYAAQTESGADAAERRALSTAFADALHLAASSLGTVLLTAELLSTPIASGDESFLTAIDELARCHDVRVAYYVRPQHTALEARWRQWGFRSGLQPSAWVGAQAGQLRYCETLDRVARLAPRISFGIRPFHPDLLEGENVVADFARHFLGLHEPQDLDDTRENAGLPLDVANLLRNAPSESLEVNGRSDAGLRQAELAQLVRGWSIPESSSAIRSRVVLHEYAFREFEPGNRHLLANLRWEIDGFVPCPSGEQRAVPGAELEEIDRLWEADASPTTLAYLHAALRDLCARRRDHPQLS